MGGATEKQKRFAIYIVNLFFVMQIYLFWSSPAGHFPKGIFIFNG